jgi:preprotein translocase subunit SecD
MNDLDRDLRALAAPTQDLRVPDVAEPIGAGQRRHRRAVVARAALAVVLIVVLLGTALVFNRRDRAATVDSASTPPTTVELVPVGPATPDRLEATAAALESRLVAAGVAASVDVGDGGIRVGVSPADAAEVRAIVDEQHQLQFRPVLRTVPASPGAGTTSPMTSTDPEATVTLPLPRSEVALVLGPSVVGGEALTSASAGEDPHVRQWMVQPVFTGAGIEAFNKVTARCYAKDTSCPSGQLAIVVDGQLLSAPSIQTPTFSGDQIQISGGFTEESARAAALAMSRSLPVALKVKGS